MNNLLQAMRGRCQRCFMPVALLVVLSVVAYVTTLLTLNQTAFVNGWDGYYYLVQIKSWFVEGSMHSGDNSLVYPLMIATKALTGDYITAYKVSSALIHSFFVSSIFIYLLALIPKAKEVTLSSKSYLLAAMVGAYAVASPTSFYFISQFPKNMLGFSFLLFFCATVELLRTRWKNSVAGNRPYFLAIMVIVLFVAAFFTHRFSGALALLVVSLYVTFYLFKRYRRFLLPAAVGAVILTVLISIFFQGTLHLSDLERFRGTLQVKFNFNPFTFISLIGSSKFTWYWLFELVVVYLGMIAFVGSAVYRFIRKKRQAGLTSFLPLLIIFFLGVFPFYNFSLTGMGYRFFLGAQLLSPLLLAPFLIKLHRLKNNFIIALSAILLVFSFFTMNSYNPELFDPPYQDYRDLSIKILDSLQYNNIKPDLIIGHKALAELMTFETGIDVLPWATGKHYNRKKVWRVVAAVTGNDYKRFLSSSLLKDVHYISRDYTLIREDVWWQFINKVKKADPTLYKSLHTWRNPLKIRPEYLMRTRKP